MIYDLTPVNKCPYRSPMAVSDAISDIIKDKVVCELGCAEGDNLGFMSRYAKQVFGIERRPERYLCAQKRGFEVIVANFLNDPIPDADVYYLWPDRVERDAEKAFDRIKQGIVILAADVNFPSEPPVIKRLAEKHNGRLIEVPYNEGPGHRENGVILLAIIEKKDGSI